VDKRDEMKQHKAQWHVAMKRSKLKKMADGASKALLTQAERIKAQIRARVERTFHVVKNLFGHRNVRCRGLAKNVAQLNTLFAFANLVIARRDPGWRSAPVTRPTRH
jgi:IS5 family transposase